ncbi:MAG: thiamine phosphate synthase [Acidimicrobiia bacterium]|nr:thiamine phosphate synthase [Acidimicrobiia bacterium]
MSPLPTLLVFTDRTQATRPVTDVVRAAVAGGARAVVLREKDLPHVERAMLAAELAHLLAAVGGLLFVASDPSIAADGVHLAGGDAFPSAVERVGRSCHTADDLLRAARQGCTYATLSPIFPTPSKPGYGPPLGPPALSAAPLPVYALGGITAANAGACRRAGAAGVAVMGAIMRAARPDRVVADLLAAVTGET